MARLIFLSLACIFLIAPSTIYAADIVELGRGNFALKTDYINFTNDTIKSVEIDKGLYVGLEGYFAFAPDGYIGMEVGYAKIEEDFIILGFPAKAEHTFIPIEANIKASIEATPNFVIDMGLGLSYNYVDLTSDDDWLFGGQFFFDTNFTIGNLMLGLNGKYQLTGNYKDSDVDYNNWRVGAQIGFMF